MTMTPEPLWWKTGVIYQVYPRSFMDANGDGVGDLAGINSRLDYLAGTLGVDAVWLSPFYPFPMADFGYDVMDYTGVDPVFGNLADFEELLPQVHKRGHADHHRLCPQPLFRPASLVRRIAPLTHQPAARLVRLGGCSPGWRPAEQLVERLWRLRLGMG